MFLTRFLTGAFWAFSPIITTLLLWLPAVADTGGSASASLTIVGASGGGEGGVAGGAGETPCEPFCAPPIPGLQAAQRADLLIDADGDGLVDPGDILRYTVLVTNFSPHPITEVGYLELIDPHLALVPDSATTSLGTIEEQEMAGLGAITAALGTLLPREVAVLTFAARVAEETPLDIPNLVGQGILYASSSFPVVTDDPETEALQDATYTPLGEPAAGWMASLPSGEPALLKMARVAPSPEVLRVAELGTEVEFAVTYANTTEKLLTGLRLVDVVLPYLKVEPESLEPGSAQLWQLGSVQVVIVDVPELAPGKVAVLAYRARVDPTVPPEIAYTASRALAFAPGLPTALSDDPLTQLSGDPTCVLFPFRCADEDIWTWDDWLKVMSSAPTGLLPLVLAEKDGSQHLRWVLYGGDFFGDLSPNPSVRPPHWPGWAFVGLLEVPFDEFPLRNLGFCLAARKEPYMKNFLSEEPLFIWAEYDMPLYARVPAADTGELLWISRFNLPFCERGYLPLLAELDWSHDWDMRWLEDGLIMATIGEESVKP